MTNLPVKSLMVVLTAATLFTQVSFADNSTNSSAATPANTVKCFGLNGCKGQSACLTANNACKGQNNCKGQGWVSQLSAEDCRQQGGKVID